MSSSNSETAAATIFELKQTIAKLSLENIKLRAALERAESATPGDCGDSGYDSHSTDEWCETASPACEAGEDLTIGWSSPIEDEATEAVGFTADVEAAEGWEKRACKQCDAMDAARVDESDDSLKARSRLEDTDFYSDPISRCRIPFKKQLGLLRACLSYAQNALWHAFGAHWPEEQRLHYLDGPASVKFGLQELEPVFGDRDFVKNTANMCGDVTKGYDAMARVVYLRNAIAHQDNLTSRELDTLMKSAQALAINLSDEKQAFRVRQRRDELQHLVRKSFATIEKRLARVDGSARPWARHHQRMFNDLRNRGLSSARYPQVVLLAAQDWCEKNTYPGMEDPEFRAAVNKGQEMMYDVVPEAAE